MPFLLVLGHILHVSVTGTPFLFRINVTRTEQGGFCKSRTYKLVDQHGEEGYGGNHISNLAEGLCLHCHTESNARLGKKGNTEIFDDLLVASADFCTYVCSAVLTHRACDNVYHAYQHHKEISEYVKLKLGTRQNKEHNEQRCRPLVDSLHQLLGEVAYITEYGSKHHRRQQRGKSNMHSSDVECHLGQGDGQKHEADGNRDSLGI